MQIETTMNLDDLAELMGVGATELQAVGMRDCSSSNTGVRTLKTFLRHWLALVDQVV